MEPNIDINYDPNLLYDKIRASQKDDKALKKACKEFESIFLAMMFKEMKKTIPDNGIVETSSARRIFEDMHIDELSKEVADGDGIGLAEMIYKQFKEGHINW